MQSLQCFKVKLVGLTLCTVNLHLPFIFGELDKSRWKNKQNETHGSYIKDNVSKEFWRSGSRALWH